LYGLGLSLIAPRVTGGEALLYKLLSHRSALTSSERISILNALAGLDGRSEPLDVEACELTALPQPAQGDSPPRRSLPPGYDLPSRCLPLISDPCSSEFTLVYNRWHIDCSTQRP